MKKLFATFAIFVLSATLAAQDIKTADSKKFDRTTTEWMALYGGGGNYGPGGSLSFFTIRLDHFFWEIARFQTVVIKPKDNFSYLFKTVYGASIYFDSRSRHELRIGTGFSAGATYYDDGDNDFFSLMNIPIDIYYVVHIKKYFAFQTGISLDLPLNFDVDDYRPVVFAFAGFRI
ncbi:MAG TPA: hypothetical protein PKG52_08710 [bacterium]|nr:hypothetical protein [bacterium]